MNKYHTAHNNNEILFWKVFKNKFLINKIIKYIQSIEWVIYDNHSQLHINNRLKFKDIHSLTWMLKNKQFQLLNSKLNKNEYIEINKTEINLLFKELSIYNNSKEEEINLLKEILIKLLEKKRNEFEILDLVKLAVEYSSLVSLKILINEPYSLVIYPYTLEYAFRYSHPLIVKELLKSIKNNNNNNYKNNKDYKEEIKRIEKESLIIACESRYKEMVFFILLNHMKSSKTTSSTKTAEEDEEEGIITNQSTKPPISILLASLLSYSLMNNLEIYKIFKVFETLITLYFQNSNIMDLPYEDTFLIYQLIHCQIEQTEQTEKTTTNATANTTTARSLTLKQLQILSVVKSKDYNLINLAVYNKLFQDYVCKYKKLITMDEIKWCNDNNVDVDVDFTVKNKLEYHQFFRMVDLFHMNIGFNNENQDEIIKDYQNGILEWNQLLLKLVLYTNNACENEKEPKLIIYDKSTIDWILNCKNISILSFIHVYFNRIVFATLEIADYVIESGLIKYLKDSSSNFKFNHTAPKIKEIIENRIYSFIWYQSIKQLDFKIINYIQSLDKLNIHELGLFQQQQQQQYKDIVFEDDPPQPPPPLSSYQLIELINYFNETGFNGFNTSKISFGLFFTQVISIFKNDEKEELLSNLKLNFKNEFYQIIIQILMESMITMDLDKVELILNSNIFKNNNSNYHTENIDKIKFKNFFDRAPKYIFNVFQVFRYSGSYTIKAFQIIEQIEKIITRFKFSMNEKDAHDNPISVMVNYYFERLINTIGVTMDQIKQVYQFINENSITVNHSLYHSFWYLHIKDIKYTYYIISPCFTALLIGENVFYYNEIYYNCSRYPEENDDDDIQTEIKLEDYLNPSIFTFETINNQSFDNVLNLIIDSLSPLISNYSNEKRKQRLNDKFNRDLEYFLIIKRIDLFFKKLENIKLFIQDSNLNNNNNLLPPTSVLYNSPSIDLLSNNTFNQDLEIAPPPSLALELFENFKNYEFQPIQLIANTFTFNDRLIKSVCRLMDLNEIKRIIMFNYYQTSFHYKLLNQSFNLYRFDIVALLLDNFKITFKNLIMIQPDTYYNNSEISPFLKVSFIFKNYFKLVQFPCKFKLIEKELNYKLFKFKFLHLLENYLIRRYQDQFDQFISNETSNENKMKLLNDSYLSIKSNSDNLKECYLSGIIEIYYKNDYGHHNRSVILKEEVYKKNEYQQLFKNLFIQKELEEQEEHEQHDNYNEIEDNIFLSAFYNGDIKLCDLILSYYPNYNFKITNQSIRTTIKNNNIHIIIYFLKNNITLFSSLTDLINYLKNHKDYKFLNIQTFINK